MEDPNCLKHGLKYLVNEKEKRYLCRICMFKSKEELQYYHENFDNFTKIYDEKTEEIHAKLKDYEGFEHINKIFKEKLNLIEFGAEVVLKVRANEKKITNELAIAIEGIYSETAKKFEETVENLTSKTEKIDLNLKSAKDDLEKIQADLDEQIEVLESEEKINEIFQKIMKKYESKLKYLDLNQYANEETKFNFRKGGGCNLFQNNSNIVISDRRNNVSYWCEKGLEAYEGPFFARLRINNITRKTDWSLNIGVIRANSTNTNSYYQDGAFFMCSGKITVQFQGNQGRNIFRQWNNGDEVLIKRDDKNDIYFGLNDDETMEKCFSNISGSYRLCVGFSNSMVGDNIEIIEVDSF